MENQKEIKKYSSEEAKKRIFAVSRFPNDRDSLLRELDQEIIPKYLNSKDKEKEIAQDVFGNKTLLLYRAFENESHVALMESFTENYRMFSKEMADDLIKEFNCTKEYEKALAKLTVNAYIRILDNSRRLNNELESREITPNKNVYIANLSKQVDRANRQFISALMTLKQLKAPQIEMNIKTNTAFISNNQQVNLNKDENIKA